MAVTDTITMCIRRSDRERLLAIGASERRRPVDQLTVIIDEWLVQKGHAHDDNGTETNGDR